MGVWKGEVEVGRALYLWFVRTFWRRNVLVMVGGSLNVGIGGIAGDNLMPSLLRLEFLDIWSIFYNITFLGAIRFGKQSEHSQSRKVAITLWLDRRLSTDVDALRSLCKYF